MKLQITLTENVVREHTIEVEVASDMDPSEIEEDSTIREAMWDAIAQNLGWDVENVLEASWSSHKTGDTA